MVVQHFLPDTVRSNSRLLAQYARRAYCGSSNRAGILSLEYAYDRDRVTCKRCIAKLAEEDKRVAARGSRLAS